MDTRTTLHWRSSLDYRGFHNFDEGSWDLVANRIQDEVSGIGLDTPLLLIVFSTNGDVVDVEVTDCSGRFTLVSEEPPGIADAVERDVVATILDRRMHASWSHRGCAVYVHIGEDRGLTFQRVRSTPVVLGTDADGVLGMICCLHSTEDLDGSRQAAWLEQIGASDD